MSEPSEPFGPSTRPRHPGILRLLSLADVFLGLGVLLAFVLMSLLCLLGFAIITLGLWQAGGSLFTQLGFAANHESVLYPSWSDITVHVLHGLEFLFLGPLPLLVFLSLARYVKSFVASGLKRSDTECEPSGDVHSTKALVVALMTASVATDLLRRAFSELSIEVAIAEGMVMVLLGIYWFALERMCSKRS